MVSESVYAIDDGVNKLCYTRSGTGSKVLLLFHGFGQDHSVFEFLTNKLGDHFTCYSFDLFGHGNSEWRSPNAITSQDWKHLMDKFLAIHDANNIAVLGFSIGGRFALTTRILYGESVRSTLLIAPDGLLSNFWFSASTQTALGRSLFKALMSVPGLVPLIVRIAHRLGIISKGLCRFVESQTDTADKRRSIYQRWVLFKNLPEQIPNQLADTLVIAGSMDPVFPEKNLNRIRTKWPMATCISLSGGHNLLRHADLPKTILEFVPA